MLEVKKEATWAIRFRDDLINYLNGGDESRNTEILIESLSVSRRTIYRWLSEESPRITSKNLAAAYRVFLNAKTKNEFLEKCPEIILKEILRYGEQYLDEIRFASGRIDKELFQDYYETDYVFRKVYYALMASNKSNTVSETYLTYKLGPETQNAIEKMIKANFAVSENGKLMLTESFLDSAFDVRRIRSQIIKLNEEYATEDQFEESNNASMLLRIFGVNEKGHQKLLAAANEYIKVVSEVWLDKTNEGPIAVASTQSMLVLENPLTTKNNGGTEQ